MFYWRVRGKKEGKAYDTHQLKLGLATRGDLHRLYTLLTRHWVEEAQECLVRLHALPILVQDLECELERVCRAQRQWRGLLSSRESA